MTQALLFNGAPQAAELAWHRGLNYGDGVFRTCFIYSSQLIDIESQIKTLSGDASRLGLQPPAANVLATEAMAMAKGEDRAVLKVMLLRAGGGGRGYRADADACDRLLCRYPAPEYPAGHWERGIQAARGNFRLAAQPALAGIKHLNRLEQVLASRAWPEGADEVIVADAGGRPLSGTRSNLFWVTGGALRTPSLSECGVAGRMRERVLAAAATLGLRAGIAPGSWDELERADEAFVTNSLIGIWPLAGLDGRRWQAPGPVTARLTGQLSHPRLVRR